MIGGYDRMSLKGPRPPRPPLVAGGPFALIVGRQWQTVSRMRAEESLQRMGLRPCPTVPVGMDLGQPCFRIVFGGTSMLIGPATGLWLGGADPDDPKNSKIAVTMPDDWRRHGHVWHFRPEGQRAQENGSEFYQMMLLLLDMFGATQLYWDAAALWSDAKMFRGALAEYLVSGMPPVLHIIAFRRTGEQRVRTRGLSYFAGQEIEALIPEGMDLQAAVRRLARLALDAMIGGPYTEPVEVPGLEPREAIRLFPEQAVGDEPALIYAEITQS